MLDAFLPAQPADVADERRASGKRGGDGEGLEIEEVAVGDEDFISIFSQLPKSYEIWRVQYNII